MAYGMPMTSPAPMQMQAFLGALSPTRHRGDRGALHSRHDANRGAASPYAASAVAGLCATDAAADAAGHAKLW